MNAIIITCRSNSSRLPGKCKMEIAGRPTIQYVIDRAKNTSADKIILCVPRNDSEYGWFCELARKNGIGIFGGSETDKLKRWRDCCRLYDIDYFVNFDGDDLLASEELADMALDMLSIGKIDYISSPNTYCGAFTHGIKTDALNRVYELKDDEDTEMCSQYFTETGIFNTCELAGYSPYLEREYRLTLDYEEDFNLFVAIFGNWDNTVKDAIGYLDNNLEMAYINKHREVEWKNKQEKATRMRMKNPQKYIGNEIDYLLKVLRSESWSSSSGSWVRSLEQSFANKFGAKYAVAMNSGTATLHCALKAVGVNDGDEVLTPALTVFMDTSAVIHAGGIPVYVDIDKNTFCMDKDDLWRKITARTKAIIAVGLYGCPVPEEIFNIGKLFNIPVIEDNAQAFHGSFLGEIASYSFENTKHISCGEGGIIITDNEDYALYCRKMANHGFINTTADDGRTRLNDDIFQNPNYKRHDMIGYNYRMPEFNAAVALAQLETLDKLVDMRRKNAYIFRDIIKDCEFLIPQDDSQEHSYYTFAVRYTGRDWEKFRLKYKEFGGDGFYGAWSIPYKEPAFEKPYYCENAELIQPQIMQFKTNYRNLDLARYKANCLKKAIEWEKSL